MVRDAVRGYWALASGLTEVTRQRALAAAKALVSQGEATAEQVSSLAEDLLSTSAANRKALLGIIQHEVGRARTAVGVVTRSDLDALTARIDALTAEVAALRAGPARKAPQNATTKATKTATTKPAKAAKPAKATKPAKAAKPAKKANSAASPA